MTHADLDRVETQIRTECPHVHSVTIPEGDDDGTSPSITCTFHRIDFEDTPEADFIDEVALARDLMQENGLEASLPRGVNTFRAVFVEGFVPN